MSPVLPTRVRPMFWERHLDRATPVAAQVDSLHADKSPPTSWGRDKEIDDCCSHDLKGQSKSCMGVKRSVAKPGGIRSSLPEAVAAFLANT